MGSWTLRYIPRFHVQLVHPYDCLLRPYELSLRVQLAGRVRQKVFLCIAPHEAFAAVYASGFMQFETSFLGRKGADGPRDFWNEVARAGIDCHHVVTDSRWARYRPHTIPLCVHVDGTEAYKGSNYLCYSVTSSLVLGSSTGSYDALIPCLVIDNELVVDETIEDVVHFLRWSV